MFENQLLMNFLSLPKVHGDQGTPNRADSGEESESESSPVELVKFDKQPKEKWDCESILSK